MKRFALIYLGTLIVLIPLDFLFIGAIGKKLFVDHIGDVVLTSPRVAPAVLFYVLYLAGVVVFVNGPAPDATLHNLLYGAMFGLVCYATFELTNMSLLKPWQWSVVITDIAWGAVLTAVSAAVGGWLAAWALGRLSS